jgi:hypothetical protein
MPRPPSRGRARSRPDLPVTETLAVTAMAALWWIPTFICLADLQRRPGLRRLLVWKWTAILCLPIVGVLAYWARGRSDLEAG